MHLDGQRCYLDANAFIYCAQLHPTFGPPVQTLLQRAKAGQLTIVTSELTIAEVLVLPFRLGRIELVAQYERLLQSPPGIEVVPVSRSVVADGTKLRASIGCRLPDAIHIASDRPALCNWLVTEDQRLQTAGDPTIVRISELDQQP